MTTPKLPKLPKFHVTIDVELRAEDIEAVDDLVHAIWSAGDPEDIADAVVYVSEVAAKPADA